MARLPHIDTIELCVADGCNLKCGYCYANRELTDVGSKHELMTDDVGHRAVDYLIEQVKKSKQCGKISFFGGEPLLNWRLIKTLVDYAITKQEKEKVKIEFGITTNGTLLTDKIISFLRRHKFNIIISIDDHRKHIHNYLRPARNGLNYYDHLIRVLKLFKKGDNVSIRATITKKNIDILRFYNYFSRFNLKSINWGPVVSKDKKYSWGEKEFRKYRREMSCYTDHVIHNWLTNADAKVSKGLEVLMGRIADAHRQTNSYFCGAGLRLAAVSVSGDLYICAGLAGVDRFCFGNIYDGVDQRRRLELLRELHIGNKKTCRSCSVKTICGGGCHHFVHELNDGDMSDCQRRECRIIKTDIDAAEKLLSYESLRRHE